MTPSTEPFKLLGSYELFIASQISSPICLSAYENVSLWCTCYISLLLNKIKSTYLAHWFSHLYLLLMNSISYKMNTDALDVNITPCYSFQASNNKINFINDEYKGNAHRTEQPHWETFQVEM